MKALYTVQSRYGGWLDNNAKERQANKLETVPCACGGAAWIRVWPEPDPALAYATLYDVICPSCRWQPSDELHWTAEAAAVAWNAAREPEDTP